MNELLEDCTIIEINNTIEKQLNFIKMKNDYCYIFSLRQLINNFNNQV